jgi:hypothetical protein
MNTWNIKDAIELIVKIEEIAPKFGCHVALTGGVLYKVGERKDLDILFYRIRQVENIDTEGLMIALESIGLTKPLGSGWIYKSKFNDKGIDIFFPENNGDEVYQNGDGAKAEVALHCHMSQQQKPEFMDGHITEIRSVNYQNHAGDGSGLPNHYLVIASVAGDNFAQHFYFPDTEEGNRQAYGIRAGHNASSYN